MEPFAKDRNAEGLVRSPLRDLSNQTLPTISDSPLSGADKEKTAVDLNNSDIKTNGSATATPRSVSPACSTPTHSNVGDTTTDEFESAEEGTPRKLSLTALAEQLDRVHLSTPQEPSDTKKPFVFPYSPAQEELLVQEDGRETPLIFSDYVEEHGDSPVKNGVASAICNGLTVDLTKGAIVPRADSELKVSPNSSANELDETLRFQPSAAPQAGSPQKEIPDSGESNIEPAILDEPETGHAEADIPPIDHIPPKGTTATEPENPDDIDDHVTLPMAETPAAESSLNMPLCDDGFQPTENTPETIAVEMVTDIIEKSVEFISKQVDKICPDAEELKPCQTSVPEVKEAVAEIFPPTENVPDPPIEMASGSPEPIKAPQQQTPSKDSIVVENAVICIAEDGQLKPCILNPSVTENLCLDPSSDSENAALHEPVDPNQTLPSTLNATVISAASNESSSPVSTKTEISELADDEDENAVLQSASESRGIPPIEMSALSSPDLEKTNELKQNQQTENQLSVKMTFDLVEPLSTSSPGSKSDKEEDTVQTGIVDGPSSRATLELADPGIAHEQAVSPIAGACNISILETSDIESNTSQQSVSEPGPAGDCTFSMVDTSMMQAGPNSTYSIDEAPETVCLEGGSTEPKLDTTQILDVVEPMLANAECESDGTSPLAAEAVNIVNPTSVLDQTVLPDPIPDKITVDAAPLNVNIEQSDIPCASEPADYTVNLDETVPAAPEVQENLQSGQLATPANLNETVLISSPGSTQAEQIAIPADINETAVVPGSTDTDDASKNRSVLNETVSIVSTINLDEGVNNKSTVSNTADALPMVNGCGESDGTLDQTIYASNPSHVFNPDDATLYHIEAGSPRTTSNLLVNEATSPNTVGFTNLDETVIPVTVADKSQLLSSLANSSYTLDSTVCTPSMSTFTNSLDETVMENPNCDVTTQPCIVDNSLEVASENSSNLIPDVAIPANPKLDTTQMPSCEQSALSNPDENSDPTFTAQNDFDLANDMIDMNSSHIFNERLNKLMAEGDEACAVPVPSAEVVPTSEKLAKAVKFEDCPPEVLEKYHISPKKPAPKKRFSLPASSITNGANSTANGLDSSSNVLDSSSNVLDSTSNELDSTIFPGAKSLPSLMNTSFTIARGPQARPRSSLMDFAEPGPQMSQILATCSRQEHDLQSDTFSCIQEEAARFAEEFKNDQDGANNEAAGLSDKLDESCREESFQPGSDFDFDFLSKVGGKSKFAANLARKSLYVKFDPLMEKVLASSDDPESELMSEFAARKQSLADETKSDTTLINETQTEVTSETLAEERLIPITPLASRKPTAKQVSQTPSLRQEITRLQEMMLQQEASHQEKEDLVEQLQKRVRELEAGLAEPPVAPASAELEEKDQRISALQREIYEAKNNSKQLVQVMEEYEKTISKLVAMKEEIAAEYERQKAVLVTERDEAHQHLANMELAFNDVHQKYERAKVVIEAFHANELSLKKNYDELMDTLKRQKEGYFKFKQHAAETLQAANNELQLKEREIARMKVVVKKDELRCKSLQETLAQKDKEIEELTQICDELIAKS